MNSVITESIGESYDKARGKLCHVLLSSKELEHKGEEKLTMICLLYVVQKGTPQDKATLNSQKIKS